jgi:tryptophan synthase alpha chain
MDTMTHVQHGIDAVQAMFAKAKAEDRAAFMPYFPIGFPNYEQSLDAIRAMAAEGVDGFEIGIPFSDPLADGAVIQVATQIALEQGATVAKCLQAVHTLRSQGVAQPMMLMGYINPLIAYGFARFVQDAKASGADGLIVPDMPPDEAAEMIVLCAEAGLALVFMLAPTSSESRIALVATHATGFIYVVSLTGVTGERTAMPADLSDFIGRVKASAGATPLVLGFGISQPEHVKMVREIVDGFIVGSALVRAGHDSVQAVRDLTHQLSEANKNAS